MAATTRPSNRSRRQQKNKSGTAEHRPARSPRRFRHDRLTAVDLFSGFGGLTKGIKDAGIDVIDAANHNRYKVQIHEDNNPEVNHWIADLANKDASDYTSPADLPAADLLVAGVTCTNHTRANTQRAYELGLTLFDFHDEHFAEQATRSERDRATALCALQYAAKHHPRAVLLECTTEIQAWGPALPGKTKMGDGSTYRWYLREWDKLEYNVQIVFLDAQFFGVGQSRNRWFAVITKKYLPKPDVEHRPMTFCPRCDETLPAKQTWKTGIPPSGSVSYGKQYMYTCPRCRKEVVPPSTPALAALDLTDLGVRIGDKPIKTHRDGSTGPLAAATMARAERCRQRFPEFPAILMPAKSTRGVERHPWQPMVTQTSQQESALLSAGSPDAATVVAVNNFQGMPRSVEEPLPTQPGSETLGIVSAGVLPFRQNTVPTIVTGESMPTVTADQIPGLITAVGIVKNNGSLEEAKYRAQPVTKPLGTLIASTSQQSLVSAGWFKQNGSTGDVTAPHPVTDSLGTLTARDTTGLLMAEWRARLAEVPLEDCRFRMLGPHEIGRGCGFDVDFPGYKGTFRVWGSNRDQVDGFGNAVPPQVGEWFGWRLRAVLHPETVHVSGWGA